jgi:hypothetical protein
VDCSTINSTGLRLCRPLEPFRAQSPESRWHGFTGGGRRRCPNRVLAPSIFKLICPVVGEKSWLFAERRIDPDDSSGFGKRLVLYFCRKEGRSLSHRVGQLMADGEGSLPRSFVLEVVIENCPNSIYCVCSTIRLAHADNLPQFRLDVLDSTESTQSDGISIGTTSLNF